MRTLSFRLSYSFLLILFTLFPMRSVGAADSFSPLSVKLTVTEPAGLARTQEPITIGIPVPKSANVLGVSSMRITASDGATSLPAQFTVLSRWGGLVTDTTKPIYWVQADFEADVPANSIAIFYLKNDGIYSPASMTATTASSFTVSTGAAAFTINRTTFNLFNQVNLGGVNIINSPPNDGLVFTDKNGTAFYAAKGSVLDSAVELDGPIHAVVMVHGQLSTGAAVLVGGDGSDSNGTAGATASPQNYPMEYRVRLNFYKNKSYVVVENMLINDGQGFQRSIVNHLYAKSMFLNTTMSLGSSHQVTFQGYTDATGNTGDAYKFSQSHSLVSTTNETPNFSYGSTKNGSAAGIGGTRAAGYADLGDGVHGVTVAIKDFWQKFPKGFRIANNVISVDTFPDVGANYWLRGGWFVTDDILYAFHAGTFDASGGVNLVTGFQSPVDARFDPTWFADSQAWGLDAPANFTMPSSTTPSTAELTDAHNRWEQLQRAKYNAAEASNGKSINTYRETRQNIASNTTGNFTSWYGWNTYGGYMWKFVNTSWLTGVQYDWPFNLLLHYLRTGNRGFYDLWGASLNHNADLSVMHGSHLSAGDASWYSYQEFWEDGGAYATSSSYTELMAQNQGFCLGYLYTGKKRYLDNCKGMADQGWTYWNAYLSTAPNYIRSELRIYGWTIYKLLNYYKVSGDTTYLNNALTVFSQGLLAVEQSPPPPDGIGSNGQGFVYDDPGTRDCTTGSPAVYQVRVLMHGYITDPLVELHRLSGSQAVLDFLTRMLNFVQTKTYVGGVSDANGNYLPNQTPYCYNPATGGRQFRDIQVIYNNFFAGGYAYLYAVTHNAAYLNFARSLFRDSVYYWEAASNTYVNPSLLTPVYLGYEPQTPKQQGWTGRFHRSYLSMEYQLQKSGGVLPSWYPGGPPVMSSGSSDTTPPAPPIGLKVQ